MGNVHDMFRLSWIKESSFRSRPAALYQTGGGSEGTATFLFGEQTDNISVPSAEATINEIPIYSSWDVSSLQQDKLAVSGDFEFDIKNAIEFYYAFGACTTTGASDDFTHTFAGLNSGSLPSRSFHVEHEGGTTAFYYDVVGCKIAALSLSCGVGERAGNLKARVSYVGCKIVDSEFADTNPAVLQSDTPPVLPTTANTDPFRMGPSAADIQWDGDNLVQLMHVNYTMTNMLMPRWTNAQGNDEYGKPERRWAQYIHELGVRRHRLLLSVYQLDQKIWGDFMDQLKKTFVIKFVRDATKDYIQLTCSNSMVAAHEITQPTPGTKPMYMIAVQPSSVVPLAHDDIDATSGWYEG